jgi:RNA polymerase sigma-70 factor (ECF subfamily)
MPTMTLDGLAAGEESTMSQDWPQRRGGGLDGGAASQDDGRVSSEWNPRQSAASGDPEAEVWARDEALMRTLYAEHAGPLLTFVLRLTGGDRQRAEDIVQETLLRAWRNAHLLGGNGRSSPRPWLVTVARRIAIDGYRSESARPPETYDRELDTLGGVADETERVLRTMTVANALRALSDPHREILIETYFKGRTVPEAAEVLGLPLGTAKSRVYYALRALRTALVQQGVTD